MTTTHRAIRFSLVLFFFFALVPSFYAQGGVCPVTSGPLADDQWLIQARCLLRTVKMNRQLGPALTELPAPLDGLIGRVVAVDKNTLKRYLTERHIDDSRIGGPIDLPLTTARYFIIHDTSSPNFVRDPFPANDVINGAEWNNGRVNRLRSGQRTHVWIDRVGDSITSRDYRLATVKTGVKLENRYSGFRGLLLHHELIQPRRCNPQLRACCRRVNGDTQCNDAIAPEPGFSAAQLDRLALLYVVASVRRGKWLIPAFHGVIDDEFGANAHDDPQNFDLQLWASRLQNLLNDLSPH